MTSSGVREQIYRILTELGPATPKEILDAWPDESTHSRGWAQTNPASRARHQINRSANLAAQSNAASRLRSSQAIASSKPTRQNLNYHLQQLVETGQLTHYEETSRYAISPSEDIERAVFDALREKPLPIGEIVSRVANREFGPHRVEHEIQRLIRYTMLEDVRGVDRWDDYAESADEEILWPTPQAWTEKGICYVCLQTLDDGPTVLVTDRRTPRHQRAAVHVSCQVQGAEVGPAPGLCADCGLPLVPPDDPPIRPVSAWDLSGFTRKENFALGHILHSVAGARSRAPAAELMTGDRLGFPPPGDVLPKAFPGGEVVRGNRGDVETRAALPYWCLIGLENREIAYNLAATLAHILDLDEAYEEELAETIHREAQEIWSRRSDAYWDAYAQLMNPAGVARRMVNPHWFTMFQPGSFRQFQPDDGFDDIVFSRPIQGLVMRRDGNWYHPLCYHSAENLSAEEGRDDTSTQIDRR